MELLPGLRRQLGPVTPRTPAPWLRLAGPNAEEIVQESPFADADNAEPGEDGRFKCRVCEVREESLTKGQCLACFFLT